MDGIFNIIIIIVFVALAVYKQVSKSSEGNTENKTRPDIPFGMDEVFPEVTVLSQAPSPPSVTKQTRTVDRFSKKTSNQAKPRAVEASPLQEEEPVNSDIDIQSIDEIRKGIIWSEILNRKY